MTREKLQLINLIKNCSDKKIIKLLISITNGYLKNKETDVL
ncbi:hypothetical protein [Clostridium septicum]|nr:hypothetical protein [Clostridium septicum]